MEQKGPTPILIILSYIVTASGFLLFFCPLLSSWLLRCAADTQKQFAFRCALRFMGILPLVAVLYYGLLFVLLLTGEPVFCNGWMLQADECHGNGICYRAGQCHCY
eukprot:COSAG02_NODE_13926_length_1330_cov_1.402112_1_plen_105_part_10